MTYFNISLYKILCNSQRKRGWTGEFNNFNVTGYVSKYHMDFFIGLKCGAVPLIMLNQCLSLDTDWYYIIGLNLCRNQITYVSWSAGRFMWVTDIRYDGENMLKYWCRIWEYFVYLQMRISWRVGTLIHYQIFFHWQKKKKKARQLSGCMFEGSVQ